jgi:hypothetical protein
MPGPIHVGDSARFGSGFGVEGVGPFVACSPIATRRRAEASRRPRPPMEAGSLRGLANTQRLWPRAEAATQRPGPCGWVGIKQDKLKHIYFTNVSHFVSWCLVPPTPTPAPGEGGGRGVLEAGGIEPPSRDHSNGGLYMHSRLFDLNPGRGKRHSWPGSSRLLASLLDRRPSQETSPLKATDVPRASHRVEVV